MIYNISQNMDSPISIRLRQNADGSGGQKELSFKRDEG